MFFDRSTVTISFSFFFFNDTATTEIYTLSLHDALPISLAFERPAEFTGKELEIAGSELTNLEAAKVFSRVLGKPVDRKSTRLNSSHLVISYAVFCLKKKKKMKYICQYHVSRNEDHQR